MINRSAFIIQSPFTDKTYKLIENIYVTMTYIANPKKYPTKKSLKEAIKEDPSKVYLDDPSIVGKYSGMVSDILKHKNPITVTNHPKRSWFAQIKIADKGKFKGQIVVK